MTSGATSPLKALIFDFDGLILDTETPDYEVWCSMYREHGFELPREKWGSIIGTSMNLFDAAEHLSLLIEGRLDSASLRARHRAASHEMTLQQPVMPGVLDYLQEAKRLGLQLAIASSSAHSWVDTHAQRLGIFEYFDKIITSDEVGIDRTKPHPDLYLLALQELNVRADEAVVFEDSPNGVRAARSAGIFVVAVPNSVTSLLTIEHADLTLQSLADLPLPALLQKVESAATSNGAAS